MNQGTSSFKDSGQVLALVGFSRSFSSLSLKDGELQSFILSCVVSKSRICLPQKTWYKPPITISPQNVKLEYQILF